MEHAAFETRRLTPDDVADYRCNDLLTEDNAAARFTELFADKLRFCHDTGAWFEWTGAAWQRNRTGLAFNWARNLARDLAESEPDKVRYVTGKTSFATGVEKFARTDPAFAVTMDAWDRDTFMLGTPGGTVDLRTGILRPADPADGITKAGGLHAGGRGHVPALDPVPR